MRGRERKGVSWSLKDREKSSTSAVLKYPQRLALIQLVNDSFISAFLYLFSLPLT